MKYKSYVRIEHYGRLLVPTQLLEKLADECYVCDTEYSDGRTRLSNIEPIRKVELVSLDEVENLLMIDKLTSEGTS